MVRLMGILCAVLAVVYAWTLNPLLLVPLLAALTACVAHLAHQRASVAGRRVDPDFDQKVREEVARVNRVASVIMVTVVAGLAILRMVLYGWNREDLALLGCGLCFLWTLKQRKPGAPVLPTDAAARQAPQR